MSNAEYAAEERPPLYRCWRVKNTYHQVSGTSDGTKSDEDAAVRMHRSGEGDILKGKIRPVRFLEWPMPDRGILSMVT